MAWYHDERSCFGSSTAMLRAEPSERRISIFPKKFPIEIDKV